MLRCFECHIEYEEGKKYSKNCGTPFIPVACEPKEAEFAEPFILYEIEAHEEIESLEVPPVESRITSLYCPERGGEYEEGKGFCKNCGEALLV